MSEEETRQNKAALLLELSENSQQLAQWRDKAQNVANELDRITNQLIREPENLVFGGEETPLQFQNKDVRNADVLNLTRICEIRDSIRSLESRRRELERSKAAYGLI